MNVRSNPLCTWKPEPESWENFTGVVGFPYKPVTKLSYKPGYELWFKPHLLKIYFPTCKIEKLIIAPPHTHTFQYYWKCKEVMCDVWRKSLGKTFHVIIAYHYKHYKLQKYFIFNNTTIIYVSIRFISGALNSSKINTVNTQTMLLLGRQNGELR